MPTILLAQEDADTRARFLALILDFFPTANLQTANSWEELESRLTSPPLPAVLLSDVFWNDEERFTDLLLLAENHPEISCAIFGRYDLIGSLPAGFPIPWLIPDEQLPLRLAELMENLSGQTFGSYEISAPAGPHPLGRLYWSKHQQLHRPVQILAPPAGCPVFPKAIRAWARVNHPSVYAIYESVPWANRILVALEPVVHPTLLHRRWAGETPSLVAWSKLATTLTSVLASMEASSVPARLLGEYDLTLSPAGVPRLRNPAAFSAAAEVSPLANYTHFAALAEPALAGQPKGDAFLRLLRNLSPSPQDAFRACQDFESQLAEFRELHVRPEELEAAQKTMRARSLRRWAFAIGGTLLTAFLVGLTSLIHHGQKNLPAQMQNPSLQVPAGELRLQGQPILIPQFQMDSFEVSIGDFEKFLEAARQMSPDEFRKLLPPESPKQSWQDLVPRGWTLNPTWLQRRMWQWDLYNSARRGDRFEGTRVTRDTAVSGLDYDSAYAYARYRGRYLPSRLQFLRAALGNGSHTYQWQDLNVGGANAKALQAREYFFGVLAGGSFAADRGPYGHADLAGNVSEWIVSRPGQRPRYMGASFSETNPDHLRLEVVYEQDPDYKDFRIGFRTVDTPGP